jgi:integrase
MPPMVKNTLETWKAVCPAGKLGLVFPNGSGNVEFHVNIIERGLHPTLVRAGVIDADGNAKYTGLHPLRHFYASYIHPVL